MNLDEIDDLLAEIDDLNNESNMEIEKLDNIISETERVAEVAKNTEKYLDDIDKEFAKRTGLTNIDIAFLGVATGLQILRQYILSPKERQNDKKAGENSHKDNEKINKKYFGEQDSTNNKQYYYASLGDILDVSRCVPYDITNGSKKFGLGGLGKGLSHDHRFKVLGHDPILGLFYGTANILTNTITTYDQRSYHVKKIANERGIQVPTIYAKADTMKVFEKVKERFYDDKISVAAALIKQIYHIKSDENSIAGIPLPFISMLSPEFAQELTEYGMDWANSKLFAGQFVGAAIIDFVIAVTHRIFYKGTTGMDLKLYKIRTKKILDYSGVIASTSNIILTSVKGSIGSRRAIEDLDLGGIAYTSLKLVNDRKYMAQVKKEFIEQNFAKLIQGDYSL